MEIVTHNPTSLAWIGDAVMSLYIRKALLDKGYRKADILQKKSAQWVSARHQSILLIKLLEENYFTQDECEIIQRGRNANVHSRAKNASVKEYMDATALESVLGYLELYHHTERLEQILDHIIEIGEVEL